MKINKIKKFVLPLMMTILSITPLAAQIEKEEQEPLKLNCISGKYPKEQIDMNLVKEGLNLYTKECDQKNASACYKLGQFYFHAKQETIPEVKEPKKMGRTFLQKSCDLNFSRACFVLGKFLKKEFIVEEKIHRSLIEKSCRLKNPYGCSALADYYYSTRFKDIKYQQYVAQSCQLGLGRNCYELSRYLREKKASQEEIRKALESGCSLNHEKSCQKLDQEQSKDT
jgi:hypothetical protein